MTAPETPDPDAAGFRYQTERFADVRILRFQVPGFEALPLQQKLLTYYLYEAALSGWEITADQHYEHNLRIRRTLEALWQGWGAAREGDAWERLAEYTKRVWFSHGIHHHASGKKFLPRFERPAFEGWVRALDPAALPLDDQIGDVEALLALLGPAIFDPAVAATRINQDASQDLVATSANNFYRGLTQAEVEAFYAARRAADDPTPVSHGLNSQLAKAADGAIVERVWKVGGMYGPALERVVAWLERARDVAEGPAQRDSLDKLIRYYRTGDLAVFDAYSIAWLADTDSRVDTVNGFIETYADPLDMRATFEAGVSIRDLEASKRIAAVSDAAPWFEAHSPIPDAYRKPDVVGVSAKVITMVAGAGDMAPAFPLGVNLPNADWIRDQHGSKSVNLGNISKAYHEAGKTSGLLEEFSASAEVVARSKAHGTLADDLHTDLHEVIGHASGRLAPGVAPPSDTLKSYAGTLEEARADLVALYFLMDPKLLELGVIDTLDVGRASYDDYIRNGLMTQLARVEPGDDLQQTHMRNRQLISRWALERAEPEGVIERVQRDGKTFFAVRDYARLRALFGELLGEVQRIKSEGDFEACRALVEGYGVKVDPALHQEVRERYARLNIAPYAGFINPRLTLVERDGEPVDVTLEYPDDFAAQQLEYVRRYSVLPHRN